MIMMKSREDYNNGHPAPSCWMEIIRSDLLDRTVFVRELVTTRRETVKIPSEQKNGRDRQRMMVFDDEHISSSVAVHSCHTMMVMREDDPHHIRMLMKIYHSGQRRTAFLGSNCSLSSLFSLGERK